MTRGRLVASIVVGVTLTGGAAGAVALTQGPYSTADCPRFHPATGALTVVRPGSAAIPGSATTGQLLVSHDRSGDASVVDLATGRVTYIEAGLTEPHEVAISSDGRWGVMSDFGGRPNGQFEGNRLAVIDMVAKRLARTINLGPNRGAHGVAFIPGTTRALVTTQSSRTIVEVDVEKGAVLGTMETRADGSHLLALMPDARTLFSVNEGNGSISRIDLPSRLFVTHHALGPAPSEGIAVTPDGRHLWVGTKHGGRVRIVDAATGSVVDSISGFVSPDRIAIAANGRRAVVIDRSCSHVVDVPTRKVIADLVGYTGSFGLSGDGRIAFMPARADGVVLIDLESRQIVGSHTLRRWPHGVAWGPAP